MHNAPFNISVQMLVTIYRENCTDLGRRVVLKNILKHIFKQNLLSLILSHFPFIFMSAPSAATCKLAHIITLHICMYAYISRLTQATLC